MVRKTNGYLEQYREEIRKGNIIAGQELIMELDRLLLDMDDPRYVYDTSDADMRIDFMEHCIKLTKSPFYGKPMKLMLWQKAYISAMYGFKMADETYVNSYEETVLCDRFKFIILLIARKNTKALDLDTRVPTPDGDRTIRDILPGDLVFNELGEPVKVLATSEIFKDRPCYEITFEDGEKVVCDENHKWTVQTADSRKRLKYTSKSGRKSGAKHEVDEHGCMVMYAHELVGDFVRVRADGKGNEYKYRVPIPAPVKYPHKELFSPYVLGQWLGNGDKGDNRICCGKDDVDIVVKELEHEGVAVSSVKEWDGKYEIRFGSTANHKTDVREAFRAMGVWENKHIPEEYFTASIEQRLDLVKGLMDTDGTCTKAGQCVFSQKSDKITEGMSRLLTSLGIKHTITKRDAKCNGKLFPYNEIQFWVDKEHTVFRYERKTARLKDKLASRMDYKSIIDIKPVESRDTKCLTVDNPRGLFLCGERNTVTHNSETSSAIMLTESIVGENGADLVCSSNDDNQASILYDAVDTMRELVDPDDLDSKRTVRFIKIHFTNNKIFKLSDKTRNKEGRNIDFAVIDEVHEMRTNVIIKSIQQSQSLKNNPKCVIITTEGFVNDGALDEILKNAREIIRGEDDGVAAERTLPWLYTQDCEAEIWQDERTWQKSNPTLGIVKKWQYLREQVDLARKSKSDRMFVLSKDFNIKQNAVQAWLNLEDYNYPGKFDPEDFRGCFGLGAVDLSETTDMTSAKILLMRKDDKTKYILSHYWIPEGKLDAADDATAGAKYREWAKDGRLTICEGNDIDLSEVADWFYMLYKTYGIKLYKCGYDQKFAKDFLKRMDEYGFECEMVVQSKQVLSNAMKLCETEFKSRLINYNEHEIDRWCLGNAAMEMDSLGNVQAVKIQGQHYKRIDGAVTFIIAYEMLRRYRSDMTNLMK